jgi:hypothetical protein
MTCGVYDSKSELILAFVHVVRIEFNLGGGSVFAADQFVSLRVWGLPVSLDFWLELSRQS